MLQKPLAAIGTEDIEALLKERTHESRTLDYKRDLLLSKDEDKRELARDVASFANSAGGDIVFGVEEAKDAEKKNLGYPGRIVGVDCPNFDATKQRLESIVRDTLDPRVQGIEIVAVPGFERGPVIIVRIPRSWSGPHMVTYQNQTHFFARNSAGRQPLDVREIRAAFLGSAEAEKRVRAFRDERIGRVLANEMPVPLRSDERVRVVIHALPLATDDGRLDLKGLQAAGTGALRPPAESSGWTYRYNLDGLVAYSGPDEGEQRTYSQAFRGGAFEGVFTLRPALTTREHDKQPPELRALYIENATLSACALYLRALRAGGFSAPVVFFLTLLGVEGMRISGGAWEDPWQRKNVIDRDVLPLPEALADDSVRSFEPVELAHLFQPVFDSLWQASGWERSLGYDDQGNRKASK